MVSDAVPRARRFAGLRLPRRIEAADVTSGAEDREASNRIAADREALRRHHQAEQQREAREREFERRWRLRL